MKTQYLKYLAATALVAVAAPAGATTLVTGFNTLSGTTVAARPELAGTVLADVIESFAAFDGSFSGQVQKRVVESIDGTIDFYWRVWNDDTSRIAFNEFRIAGFEGYLTDADFRIDGLGDVGPDRVVVFGPPNEGAINFRFTNGLQAGESSKFFFIDTNATSYDASGIYDVAFNSRITSPVGITFAPGAVPEPATWLMMIGGLGLAGASLRRRAKVSVRFA